MSVKQKNGGEQPQRAKVGILGYHLCGFPATRAFGIWASGEKEDRGGTVFDIREDTSSRPPDFHPAWRPLFEDKAGLSIKVLIVSDDWSAARLKTENFLCLSPTQPHCCRCYRPLSNLRPRCRLRSRRRRRRWSLPSFCSLFNCPSQRQITPQGYIQPPSSVVFQLNPLSSLTSTFAPFLPHSYISLRKAPCLNNRTIFKRESPPLVAKPSSSRRKFVPNGSLPQIPVVRIIPHLPPSRTLTFFRRSDSSRYGR